MGTVEGWVRFDGEPLPGAKRTFAGSSADGLLDSGEVRLGE